MRLREPCCPLARLQRHDDMRKFREPTEEIEMSKGMDRKKDTKKKPLKSPAEKRAEKQAKKAERKR